MSAFFPVLLQIVTPQCRRQGARWTSPSSVQRQSPLQMASVFLVLLCHLAACLSPVNITEYYLVRCKIFMYRIIVTALLQFPFFPHCRLFTFADAVEPGPSVVAVVQVSSDSTVPLLLAFHERQCFQEYLSRYLLAPGKAVIQTSCVSIAGNSVRNTDAFAM